MIFDVIICSTIQKLSNFRPLVAVLQVKLQNFVVFILAPAIFLYIRVQVVVPSLAALLSDSTFQVVSDLTPILSAVKPHLLN